MKGIFRDDHLRCSDVFGLAHPVNLLDGESRSYAAFNSTYGRVNEIGGTDTWLSRR